ncbi:MAG: 2-hydroxyacyl-CoA dehydratase family protein [Proteobacteria bacterium]|nr:2-hydroxyacyl-CoA dehydratase family protein [Pseudomonadota bacterium]
MTRFKALSRMKEIMTDYYVEAKTTREKPVAWVTSGAPVEFLFAMDVIPIYPENYAAMCAANHQSLELMEAAEAAGFSQDICAYARTDFGADITQGGPVGGLPAPRFLLCSTNICKTVIKWYEVVARKYDVPLFIVDTPFLHHGLTRELIDYTVTQMKHLEAFLAETLGRPFDRERFLEVLQLSNQASTYWMKMLELGRKIPSPFNSLDTFIHLGPIVTLRGTRTCVDYYKLLYEEVAERAARNIPSVPGEKYRLLWDNLPVWFKMRRLGEFFEERKTTLVTTTYANSWGNYAHIYQDGSGDIYEPIAAAYLNVYINYGFEDRIRYLASLIEEFSLTGFVMHSNRSCKPYSVGMYRMQEELTRLTGKPGVVIEADQNDPRAYSDAQVETRLEALIESMEAVS